MKHDVVIRNGNIIDGTGAPAFEADIAIDGDSISVIGQVSDKGTEEIDAKGLAVTPGFVDLHTHLDAQIGWDPDLTSITWHGVTTALLGNCGVTFAPCKPGDKEFLAGMMETVEDIPKKAILSGLPWDWESYGGYLDSIERAGPQINVGGLAGHCAIRFYVMGERSVEEPASPEEIAQIAKLAGDSVRQGALGFSTNRHLGHLLPDGRCIPGTHAEHEEVRAVAAEVGKAGGIMQTVMNFKDMEREMDLIGEGAALARGALFSAVAGPTTELGTRLDERVSEFRNNGHNVTAVTVPRSGGGVGGLATNTFFRTKKWNELRRMTFEERVNAIRDADFRQALVDDLKDHPHADQIRQSTKHWYPMGVDERPVYTQDRDESVLRMAEVQGVHPAEVWLKLTLETDGKMLFHHRGFNVNLDALAEMISTDWAMPGLGDAGAHVSQMIDSGWSTFVLSHWYRDVGLYSLEEAVRRIAGHPAEFLGLRDRGTLATGKKADINVIDIASLAERQPQLVNDFPHGAPRFIQRAVGYKATLCNGAITLRDDEHTGHRGGQMLRSQS
ncbi:MAG: amidohydrolase [Gammaproteobacteria bacterium]|nr:amidohydrolase [Gammaproteobacteria bacterium]RPG25673.1 MAG: amidohydrolase [Gammaproteobacteria bacterium TMED50]|tara:strand:+ start:14 stop:1684 length:1671 start_codon:yes stop_codon:yes gene_type:complete